MKAKSRMLYLYILSVVCVAVAGCVSQRSVKSSEPFSMYIGKTFVTTNSFFLARAKGSLLLLEERKRGVPKDQCPTFREFEEEGLAGKRFAGLQYVAILPKGSIIELVDILRTKNMELGTTYSWYGRVADPPAYAAYKSIDLAGFFKNDSAPSEMYGARPQ